MRALQDHDFEQMATRVVDRFMSGSKLADAATQEAMGGELAPDQIERMVQAANTMAFLRLMEQQKAQATGAAPDMTHEFDPIDTRQIVQQIMGQVPMPHAGVDESAMHDQSMDHAMPLPDEIGAQPPKRDGDGDGKIDFDGDHDDDDDDGPFPKGEKQKAKDKEKAKDKKSPPKAPEKDTAKEAAFRDRRRRKLADVFDDQYQQAEWAFEDEMVKLGQLLRRAHGAPSMLEFEKNALAIDGSEIGVVVLNMVREARGWPSVSMDDARAKHAALVDRHVVDDNETTRSYERLVKIASEAARLKQGAEFLRSQCA